MGLLVSKEFTDFKINVNTTYILTRLLGLWTNNEKISCHFYLGKMRIFYTENKQTGQLICFCFWSLWPKYKKWNEPNTYYLFYETILTYESLETHALQFHLYVMKEIIFKVGFSKNICTTKCFCLKLWIAFLSNYFHKLTLKAEDCHFVSCLLSLTFIQSNVS